MDISSTDSMFGIFDVLAIILVIGYGIKYLINPPKMSDQKGGFRMEYLMRNEEIFNYGNRVAAILCIILGVVLGILSALRYFVFADNMTLTMIDLGLEIACVALMLLVLRITVEKKYGKIKHPYKRKK